MTEPFPRAANLDSPFEELAGKYDAWFDREGSLVFEIEKRAFEGILTSLPKPWVEIGAGSGRFAQALGIDTGIEPSHNLGKMAEERGIKVTRARGEERIFPAASFGTVFLIVTLCFVSDPLLVLRRASEILKESGMLILGLIVEESPWALFYTEKKERGHPFYSIARFYGYGEVLKFLEQTGFEHEITISTLFQAPEQVERMELPREGFDPRAGFTIIAARKKS